MSRRCLLRVSLMTVQPGRLNRRDGLDVLWFGFQGELSFRSHFGTLYGYLRSFRPRRNRAELV